MATFDKDNVTARIMPSGIKINFVFNFLLLPSATPEGRSL